MELYYFSPYVITDSFFLLLSMMRGENPAEVAATHQPFTVNTEKGAMEGKSVTAPWESSNTGV